MDMNIWQLTPDRKHTGERPFQCHCSRRFSRLDNLRQHAQTVHVNEEIPGDSLAATGTRFQRQIRTDRVRPAGRPRSGTMSSTGSHSRGHSRNLSTSSIGSNASTYSNSAENRRRPPPLIMASEPGGRPKLGIEPPKTPPMQYRGYATNSPGGLSTPTSATYSAVPGSPSFGSPASSASRPSSFYGVRTPGRRLSTPSSVNPFQPNYNSGPGPAYSTAVMQATPVYSNNASVYASPTQAAFAHARSDPNTQASDDWRRRTWHASSYSAGALNYSRPATSGLTYSQTPDAPQPSHAQHATAAAGQAPRLPGIESFDQMSNRPATPPRRQPSPMHIDTPPQPPMYPPPQPAVLRAHPTGPDHRRNHVSWDMSLHSNLTRLDLQGQSPRDSASWGQQTINDLQGVAARPSSSIQPQFHQGPIPQAAYQQHQRQVSYEHSQGRPHPQYAKRQAWYNGPPTATRTSPEDSSSSEGVPTPGTSAAEFHPAIVHSNGYIEPQHPVIHQEAAPNVSFPQFCH